MRFYQTLLAASFLALLPASGFAASAAPALTDAQKAEVEAVVRDLLTKKEPELVIKAAQTVSDRMEQETQAKSNEALSKHMDKIVNDPTSPNGGNLKGDVTVVEFFDYSCGYCKMGHETVTKLLSEDKNVRFVYKELPILGVGSKAASKAALASVSQGKYIKFHDALMTAKDRLTEESVYQIAKDVGLDVEKLKKDMADEKIEKTITANIALAKELGANGTPTFIVGSKLYPGAMPIEQLKEAVAEARSSAKKK